MNEYIRISVPEELKHIQIADLDKDEIWEYISLYEEAEKVEFVQLFILEYNKGWDKKTFLIFRKRK